MKKCKVCGNKTEVVFNIDFKAKPICEGCATAIFLQQAKWYAETQGQKLPIHNVISLFCHHNGTYTTIKDDDGNEICCKCRKPLAK
jgi:protein-arginine kinase activator protein McsA